MVKKMATLDNVLYLTSSAKNLISISKWSEDKGDDCGVFTRQHYSIFYWDNDNKSKKILHYPSCKIPLMTVNEREESNDPFAAFMSSHEHQFLDKDHIITESPDEEPEMMDARMPDWGDMSPPSDYLYQKGDTVKASIKGENKVCIVDDIFTTGTGAQRYRVRVLNQGDTYVLFDKELSDIRPDPSDIPLDHSEVDSQVMTEMLYLEDL